MGPEVTRGRGDSGAEVTGAEVVGAEVSVNHGRALSCLLQNYFLFNLRRLSFLRHFLFFSVIECFPITHE